MFTEVELLDAIDELHEGKKSIQNCERLAAVYTVLDHLYNEPKTNRLKGMPYIADKDPEKFFQLFDELMEALQVLNPNLYQNFMSKLEEIR